MLSNLSLVLFIKKKKLSLAIDSKFVMFHLYKIAMFFEF